MIKRLIIILCLLMWAGVAIAAPKVKTTVADVKGKYVYLKIVYTSDGTDAAAVDIVAAADSDALRYIQRGFTAMVLNADPDTGGTSPANDVDAIFTDITGIAIRTTTGNAIAAATDTLGIDMSDDLGQYPVITSSFTITLEDIGSSGDKITFYLIGWVENN